METLQKEVLYPREMIEKRVADLIRCLSIPCRVDFVRLASYGAGASSSGKVVITRRPASCRIYA